MATMRTAGLAHRRLAAGTGIILAFSVLACEEEEPMLAPATPSTEAQSPERAFLAQDVSALGTIPLPVSQTFIGSATAFRIQHGGPAGHIAQFELINTSNAGSAIRAMSVSGTTSPTIRAENFGRGPAGTFTINSNTNPAYALNASTPGTGGAAAFRVTNQINHANVLLVSTNGRGSALLGTTTGTGSAAIFQVDNEASPAPALVVRTIGSGNAVQAATDRGAGNAVQATVSGIASGSAGRFVNTTGNGWAGDFLALKNGVRISTNSGGVGLQVSGGSKNAVVGTTSGARALYSEEATEVWFADYGFGRLEHGRTRILLDPTFAQTINPEEPYHVFIEEYGDAQLHVADRTPLGFVVRSHDGQDVEFSYRVVAKRRGFESQRLERAPWADNTPGF